jgi:hypothetical protein
VILVSPVPGEELVVSVIIAGIASTARLSSYFDKDIRPGEIVEVN